MFRFTNFFSSLFSVVLSFFFSSIIISISFTFADLEIIHYNRFADCSGATAPIKSYSQDSCIFGEGGKTSSQYFCNGTHAISYVYTKTSDCTDPDGKSTIKTEARLDVCHRIISTSIRFVCNGVGKILGTGSVVFVCGLILVFLV